MILKEWSSSKNITCISSALDRIDNSSEILLCFLSLGSQLDDTDNSEDVLLLRAVVHVVVVQIAGLAPPPIIQYLLFLAMYGNM